MTSGIRVLKFSPDGKKLLAVTCDSYNSMFVFNLSNFSLITTCRGDRNTILDAVWTNNACFSTVGIKHFKKWDLKEGRLKNKKGLFG
jgi:WD40 repeat protein